MPKDASKNVDRYKVRGGDINEFEYHQNQEQFVATKGTKSSKKTATAVTKGATAKKLAARKAAAKK
jgi:hypothetical protein